MKKIRMLVNSGMTVVLLCLMAYSLIGEMTHEILGTVMFVLFIVHHILNKRWFGALTKGKYGAFRVLQTGLVFVLILSVLASAASGIMLSNQLYTFLPRIRGAAAIARNVHLVCAYLNFMLMSLHLGMHWNTMISTMGRNHKERSDIRIWGVRILAFIIAAYGIFVFVKRQIGEYLLLRTHFVFFDFSEPIVLFFLDYIAIMGLFVFIGYYLTKFTKWCSKKRKQGGKERLA